MVKNVKYNKKDLSLDVDNKSREAKPTPWGEKAAKEVRDLIEANVRLLEKERLNAAHN